MRRRLIIDQSPPTCWAKASHTTQDTVNQEDAQGNPQRAQANHGTAHTECASAHWNQSLPAKSPANNGWTPETYLPHFWLAETNTHAHKHPQHSHPQSQPGHPMPTPNAPKGITISAPNKQPHAAQHTDKKTRMRGPHLLQYINIYAVYKVNWRVSNIWVHGH